jgi:hypothetical protein
MPNYKWWEEHKRLWQMLVPARGQSLSVQGELIRCIGKLTDEAYRNGNLNWNRGYRLMLDYIGSVLLGDATLSGERRAKVLQDINEIKASYKCPDTRGHGTCYYTLNEAVVDWCMQHTDLIPRDPNPDLDQ